MVGSSSFNPKGKLPKGIQIGGFNLTSGDILSEEEEKIVKQLDGITSIEELLSMIDHLVSSENSLESLKKVSQGYRVLLTLQSIKLLYSSIFNNKKSIVGKLGNKLSGYSGGVGGLVGSLNLLGSINKADDLEEVSIELNLNKDEQDILLPILSKVEKFSGEIKNTINDDPIEGMLDVSAIAVLTLLILQPAQEKLSSRNIELDKSTIINSIKMAKEEYKNRISVAASNFDSTELNNFLEV